MGSDLSEMIQPQILILVSFIGHSLKLEKREAACFILEPPVLEIIIPINLIDFGMKYLWHGVQTLRLCYVSCIETCL